MRAFTLLSIDRCAQHDRERSAITRRAYTWKHDVWHVAYFKHSRINSPIDGRAKQNGFDWAILTESTVKIHVGLSDFSVAESPPR